MSFFFKKRKKMAKLNEDVLDLILKELKNDRKSIYPCLLVNKTWCKIIVPILWKNPWKYLTGKTDIKVNKSLLNVIISHLHLSYELKENLKSQGVDLLVQQRPLFNYI